MSFTPDELSLIHDTGLIARRRQCFHFNRDLPVIRAAELTGSVERGIEIARALTRQESRENRRLHAEAVEGELSGWSVRVDSDDLSDAIAEDVQFILTAKSAAFIDKPMDRSVIISKLDDLCQPLAAYPSVPLVFITD